jgi:hypothetical protein
MLSTLTTKRNAPNYELYKKMIEFNWPETLMLPVNPPKGCQ